MQLERYLIEHCAPTLASLKAGSLICLKETVEGELDRQISYLERTAAGKGACFDGAAAETRRGVGLSIPHLPS